MEKLEVFKDKFSKLKENGLKIQRGQILRIEVDKWSSGGLQLVFNEVLKLFVKWVKIEFFQN